MKKNRKGYRVFTALTLLSLAFSACGASGGSYDSSSPSYIQGIAEGSFASTGSSYDSYDTVANFSEYEYEQPEESYADGSVKTAEEVPDNSRKLIRTASLNIETKEFDTFLTAVESRVAALGGYIEYSNTYNGSSYYNNTPVRNADLTIRVPARSLDEFLDTVSNLGNVTRKNTNVQDVTLTYVDLESEKKAYETEQARLLELLERAETMEEILTIESRLTTIRYQIQSMESRLRTYDNQVDYSTVSLSITEVRELTIIEEEPETVGERITKGFRESLEDVGNGATEFFVWFVTNLPKIVVWVFVIFLIVKIFYALFGRKHKERRTAKKAQKRAQKEAQKAAKRAAKGGQPAQAVPPMQAAQPAQPDQPVQVPAPQPQIPNDQQPNG